MSEPFFPLGRFTPQPLLRLIFSYDGADQFCRGDPLTALLPAFPIPPQMLPPLHCLRERVFANVSHRFELTIMPARFNGISLETKPIVFLVRADPKPEDHVALA